MKFADHIKSITNDLKDQRKAGQSLAMSTIGTENQATAQLIVASRYADPGSLEFEHTYKYLHRSWDTLEQITTVRS